MAETIVWTAPERILFMFNIFILLIGGLKYFFNARKREEKKERMLLLGFAFIASFSAIACTIYFFIHFYRQGTVQNGIFIGTIDDNLSPIHEITFIGHIMFHGSFVLFLLQFERSLQKSYYILTILGCIFYIIDLISFWIIPINWDMWYISVMGIIILDYIALFWLLKISNIQYQNLSLLILMGVSISFASTLFDQPIIKDAGLIPIELGRLIGIFGNILLVAPAFLNIEHIIKSNPKRMLVIFITIDAFVIIIYLIVFPYIIEPAIISLLLCFFMLVLAIYIHRRNIRFAQQGEVPYMSPETQGILTAFSKPKTLTEKEVSISKEKKICLVCKGRIGGINFMCLSCGTLYCRKCYDALTNLENSCWACDSTLDETKPVKRTEPEPEEIEAETELKKK